MSGDFGATTPHPKIPIRFLIGGIVSQCCQGNCMTARVNKRAIRSACLLLSILVVCAACPRRREHAAGDSSATTQTVAPAAAQPAPTGTDALTQTVDVEDGRSEEDGGTTTMQQPSTAAAAPAKKPPAKTKK